MYQAVYFRQAAIDIVHVPVEKYGMFERHFRDLYFKLIPITFLSKQGVADKAQFCSGIFCLHVTKRR